MDLFMLLLIIMKLKTPIESPGVGISHYGELLRPATPPFFFSPLLPAVFTCLLYIYDSIAEKC